MTYDDIISSAAATVGQRGKNYGGVTDMFEKVAHVAGLITGKTYSKYEITTILEAVKLVRRSVNPLVDDNYIDGINYMAFSALFAKEAFAAPALAQPASEDDTPAGAKRKSP